MKIFRGCGKLIFSAALASILLSLTGRNAVADSITVSETWKDNTVDGAYNSSTDIGTFNASLTVPGLSSLSSEDWSNLLITIYAPSLITGEDSSGDLSEFQDNMGDASAWGGTTSPTSATFLYPLTDTNGATVNAYEMSFSRSGDTLIIKGQTLNPPSLGNGPWSIVAWNYFDNNELGTSFSVTNDPLACEIVLQDVNTLQEYDDVVQTVYVNAINTITFDTDSYELYNIKASGAADFTPPVLTDVSPAGSLSTTNGLLSFSVKATDNIGVSNVEFYVNGVDYGPGDFTAPSLWLMNFALSPGSNRIQAVASDVTGNLTTNTLTATYLNKQTNANVITFSEHWLDSSQTNTPDNPGVAVVVSQDVGVLNAALAVPGLASMSGDTWSNLQFSISFGDLSYSSSLASANILTPGSATFYLDQTTDINDNPLILESLTVSRSGNTLLIAAQTGNPTYLAPDDFVADAYLGLGSPIHDSEPFTLTLSDGNTSALYANVSRPLYFSGTDTTNFDGAGNELNNLQISGYADYLAPTLQITAPTPGQHWSNGVFTVTGKAADNIGLANVFYSVNNSGWLPANPVNTFSNWTAVAQLAAGTNTISAYAVDTSGNYSATNQVNVVDVVSGVLTVNVGTGGTVSPNYNGALLQIGQNYTMTAKTNAGFGFTGWTGSLTTNKPTITFQMASNLVLTANFADIAPPTNAITAPVAGQRWSNSVFTVTGKAGDNVAVANVFYSLNGSGWSNAAPINNWSNWTAQVTLTPGTNTLMAYAVDTSGNVSKTNVVSMVYVLSGVLTVNVGTGGTVSPNYNGALLQIGQNYTMTAKTNVGFGFTGWTGSLTTNKPTLTFQMASNLVLTANFADTAPPTNSITAPVANQRWSNSVFTVTGKSEDNVAVANVFYSLNGSGWSNAVPINNWSNWSAQVTLTPGTNTLMAYAVDTSGNVSKTNVVSMVYVLSGVLTVNVGTGGTVSPNYNGALLQIGQNYTMAAKTNIGFAFTGWTGSLATNSPTLTFQMASNLVFNASFVETAKPTLTITAPLNGQTISSTNMAGTARDDWGVSGVWVQVNSNSWNLVSTGNAYTNWNTTLALVPGTNTIQAYAVNLGGNYSATNLLKVVLSSAVRLRLDFSTAKVSAGTGDTLSLLVPTNSTGRIQVSTDLVHWVNLTDFAATNATVSFHDPAATSSPGRFYRAVIP
jgi:uncharacterized repeat protein (TIGR02543 family)